MCLSKKTSEFREAEPLVDESPSQDEIDGIIKGLRPGQKFSTKLLCYNVVTFLVLLSIGVLIGIRVSWKGDDSAPLSHDDLQLHSKVTSTPTQVSQFLSVESTPESEITSVAPSIPRTKISNTTLEVFPPSIAPTKLPSMIIINKPSTPPATSPQQSPPALTKNVPSDDLKGSVFGHNGNFTAQKIPGSPPDNQKMGGIRGKSRPPGAVYGYHDIDWSDCIFRGPVCDKGSNYSPIVIPDHRLIFFTVPKNGSTEWMKLFRRMMGFEDWKMLPPHNPKENGLKQLYEFSRSEQVEMMLSPKWTRAMFVRDPMERVLSAYLNKALSPERYLKKKCCLIYPKGTEEEREMELQLLQRENQNCVPLAPYEQLPTLETFPFDDFVNNFLEQCDDIHWRPQSYRVKYKNWKFLNFIGKFDNLHEDMYNLLIRTKAYFKYAKTGWGDNGDLELFETQRSEEEGPVTHSHDRIKEFYTPELRKKVLLYAKQDYINQWLNLTKPEGFFDAIQGNENF